MTWATVSKNRLSYHSFYCLFEKVRYRCFPNFNPYVTNGLSHSYHLDDITFFLRDIMSNFSFLFHFWMKYLSTNSIVPDETLQKATLQKAASHLGLIRITCPCNEHRLTPHFYIEKVGFTRVYIFFLFLLQNIDCGYSLEPPH